MVAGGAGDTRCFVCVLFSREGGSPDWVPAFAGKHFEGGRCADARRRPNQNRYPGENPLPGGGRGPVGGRLWRRAVRRYCDLPNWTPAFAGVVACVAGRADVAEDRGMADSRRPPPRAARHRVYIETTVICAHPRERGRHDTEDPPGMEP
ncbi:hypothetical protein SPHINGOT1_20045 [Sphingomonas sp. T1]|nr:hypothetical protein SPHINGOT1_20045 [Sphingomonas sp. T1]